MTLTWFLKLYLLLFKSLPAMGVSYSVSGYENGRSYRHIGFFDAGTPKILSEWVEQINKEVGNAGKLVALKPRWE